MTAAHFPGFHVATKRLRVTVAEWAKRPDSLVDTTAYYFNPHAEKLGIEAWRLVEGVDPRNDGDVFDVWMVDGACYAAPGHAYLYIREQDAQAMGFAPPLTAGAVAGMDSMLGAL